MPVTEYQDTVAESVINERFRMRPCKGDQPERLLSLSEHSKLFARHILRSCPPSYERDEALKAVDLAFVFCNAAIIRNE